MKTETIAGHPIKCYDNGGPAFTRGTIDRYTVVYMDSKETGGWTTTRGALYDSLGMSASPFHPQGVAQHSLALPGQHLGKRIPFATLPEDCRIAVMQDLTEPS